MLITFTKAGGMNGTGEVYVFPLAEEQGARAITTKVLSHTDVRHANATQSPCAMVEGALKLSTRATLTADVLRRSLIDCSFQKAQHPAAHRLRCRGPQTLFGVKGFAVEHGVKEGGGSGPL